VIDESTSEDLEKNEQELKDNDVKSVIPNKERVKKRIHRIPLKLNPLFLPGMSKEDLRDSIKNIQEIKKDVPKLRKKGKERKTT